jgi:glycosyltransferase involved in cell wall biosynthesis
MKIAILITSLNTGGAERTAVALANWLANNENNEVFLINLGKNDNNYEIDEKVNFYNKSLEKGRIHSYIAVFKYLNKVKPDVLFEMLFKPLKYALIYKIFHKNSVVIGSERSNPQKYPKRYLKFLSKICPIFCDGYIFQTNMVKEMFSLSVQRKSIVIPNAISNPDVYLTKHSSTPLKQIISVARLTYQKGQDTLIKAFSKFLKIHP